MTGQSKVHKQHRSDGQTPTTPSLPCARHHQFRLRRLQELEARRGRHLAPPFLPNSRAHTHPDHKTISKSHTVTPEGPRPETRAKAAGKLTFHLASYFSSPILTLANESPKTAGGRDLAVASPCRLDGGGARGGAREGRCPYPSRREPRGGCACALGRPRVRGGRSAPLPSLPAQALPSLQRAVCCSCFISRSQRVAAAAERAVGFRVVMAGYEYVSPEQLAGFDKYKVDRAGGRADGRPPLSPSPWPHPGG